ncbi:MAG: PASTA domain-containing protein [Clostridia bacterium]|nr:PASTA domain-containing protein [Clostridia bacterium]
MKKIIAAAMSVLLGAFGFTITDKKVEERLDDLEASVSSMQEEISSLHARKPIETTTTTTTEPYTDDSATSNFWDDFYNETAIIDITLPNTGAYGYISATLDGSELTAESLVLDGSVYPITVHDSGSISLFKAYVNGKLVYKCNIDFTTTPCSIYNVATYDYENEITEPSSTQNNSILPNVIGYTLTSAKEELETAGFANITFSGSGTKIISQYPLTGSYPSEIAVTLYLGE